MYLSSNFYAFSLQNDHIHALLMVHKKMFYFKMGSKRGSNFAYLEGILNFWFFIQFDAVFLTKWSSFIMYFWILCYFILKRDIQCQIPKFCIRFFFLYLEDIFNTWNSRTIQMSKIQYVQQITVYRILRWQARYCFHTCF